MLRMTMRLVSATALVTALTAAAKPDPVQWTASASAHRADGSIVLTVKAAIENGWYIYSMQQPANGPAPLRFRTPAGTGSTVGKVTAPQPRISYDEGFRARVGKYYGSPVFVVSVQTVAAAIVPLEIRYQTCNDTICLPPRTKTVQARVTSARR